MGLECHMQRSAPRQVPPLAEADGKYKIFFFHALFYFLIKQEADEIYFS